MMTLSLIQQTPRFIRGIHAQQIQHDLFNQILFLLPPSPTQITAYIYILTLIAHYRYFEQTHIQINITIFRQVVIAKKIYIQV